MELRGDLHESAVREQRVWIRLNRLCNNRCIFCLDSDSHDGSLVAYEEVEAQILRGARNGGERLILSGGEATLHPRYLDFLRLGKEAGYTWLQTISNGRMFAYPSFAEKALAAGLQEVTLSIHGHNEALHDKLVGVPGAFKQTMAGLRNLLGRCIVSVDIVLNLQNVPHLKEILQFFISMGVSEFDLLHMVPFGRAWSQHRSELFYDPKAVMPHLKRAFALRRKYPIVLWTNRLPAAFLEGEEDLIQDPHKLHDEVRGRHEMLQSWADRGEAPCCKGDRCDFCPMQGFCGALEPMTPQAQQGNWESVRASLATRQQLERAKADGRLLPLSVVRIAVEPDEGPEVGRWAEQLREQGHEVWLELPVLPQWDLPASVNASLASIEGADAGVMQRYLAAPSDVQRWLPMEAGLAEVVPPGTEVRQNTRIFAVPRDYLSESRQKDASPEAIRALVERYGRILGMPDCLGGEPLVQPKTDLTLRDEEGKLDLVRFTDWFIRNAYRVKSLRCGRCQRTGTCQGLHINYARNHGFGVLTPFEGA